MLCSIIFWEVSSEMNTLMVSVLKVYYLSCPGGFIHGIKDLTYGVDIEYMRWMGILQVYLIVFSC